MAGLKPPAVPRRCAESPGDGGGSGGELPHALLVALVGDGVGGALDEQPSLRSTGGSGLAEGGVVCGVEGEGEGLVAPSGLAGEDSLLAGGPELPHVPFRTLRSSSRFRPRNDSGSNGRTNSHSASDSS
ncbi:hypothetical protein [Streptomyces sp. NPDC127190]|uniref:hypothetical protein n=1 Tax=unclassified Streptomyces TaxID=2593676 RepID=UPI00363732B9